MKQSRPQLRALEAQLYVADVTASCAFYGAKLGFAVEFTFGEPPFYGQVRRGAARLNLRFVHEPVFNGDIREREELLSASITLRSTADLENLFLEFEAKDVPFAQHPKDEPWGARTFIVVDPDGNRLLFAGPAT